MWYFQIKLCRSNHTKGFVEPGLHTCILLIVRSDCSASAHVLKGCFEFFKPPDVAVCQSEAIKLIKYFGGWAQIEVNNQSFNIWDSFSDCTQLPLQPQNNFHLNVQNWWSYPLMDWAIIHVISATCALSRQNVCHEKCLLLVELTF